MRTFYVSTTRSLSRSTSSAPQSIALSFFALLRPAALAQAAMTNYDSIAIAKARMVLYTCYESVFL